MQVAVQLLDLLFGRGDSDYPLWLLAVRLDILLFLGCAAAMVAHSLGEPLRRRRSSADPVACLALTGFAALLRLLVEHNVTALGGIGYSRILFGYRGHFGTAQLYALVYAHAGRSLEHAIWLNRFASTVTVPLVYALCRRLAPSMRSFAPIAAGLLAVQPLHLLFTPTDGLPISTSAVAAGAYLMLVTAATDAVAQPRVRTAAGLGAAAGLALLTQIRLENTLLLAPPALYLALRRHELPLRQLAPGGAVLALLLAVYGSQAVATRSFSVGWHGGSDGLRTAGLEVSRNPIFGLGPLLLGTAAAVVARRSRVRLLASLPLLALVPVIALAIAIERHDYGFGFVPLARIYTNLILPLVLVAAYGFALLWESRRRSGRILATAGLLWAASLPILYWANLRQRYAETVEHDFLRTSLASLPPGVDRIVVPDDEPLAQATHTTIELIDKYRMITGAAGIDLIPMTRFLDRPSEFDCRPDNCLFFRGLPCSGLPQYRFLEERCADAIAHIMGEALIEQDFTAGSFLDCSLDRHWESQAQCTPTGEPRRIGLYRPAAGQPTRGAPAVAPSERPSR